MKRTHSVAQTRTTGSASFTTFPRELWISFLLIAALFFPEYSLLWERFNARDSYYSHGILIPFISLYLFWRKRALLRSLPVNGSWLGLCGIIGAGTLHLAGLFLRINVLSYFMIPVMLWSTVLFLWGGAYLRALFFPVFFLVFMLPLPSVMIIGLSFKMKLLAAEVSTRLIQAIGLQVMHKGSTILFPGGSLEVGDPCSGLRSLITFLALGALLTQFARGAAWKKYIFFLSSLAIAVLSNVVRISFLVIVSYFYGEKAAMGFVHDFSGYMVFVIGFLGLLGVSSLLGCPLHVEGERKKK